MPIMLDKYKVLRKAEKFVIEQKFSQAIQEYEKLLQQDGDDPSLLNTIGDLLIRVRKTPKALEYFHKVAQIYLRSGFALRAIATFKKIHRLDPNDLSVNKNLADLFQKQGLNQDACRHLDILIRLYQQAGDSDEAMAWMTKAVELDPHKAANHLLLAEALSDKGERSRAADHYVKAVDLLLQKKQYEQALEACRLGLNSAEHHPRLGEAHAEAADYLSRLDEADEFLNSGLAEDGPVLPLQFGLVLVAERKGEISRATRLLEELIQSGHDDDSIRETLQRLRAADFLDSEPSQPEEDEPEPETAAEPQAESGLLGGGEAQEFDFSSEDWGEDQDQQENPFHPAGTVEEVLLEGDGQTPAGEGQGSGLFLEDESKESASPDASGFFEIGDSDSEPFLAEDGLTDDQEEQPEPAEELGPEGAEAALSEAGEPGEEISESEDLDDYSVASLEEALEEADFYLKLGFQEEATRVLKVLLRDYPDDERVLRRAKKVPGLAAAPSRKQAAAKQGAQVAEFDKEIDAALDVLFEGDEEHLPTDEVLRYDVQKSGQPRGENPKVHYDLGLAYKEMGLVEDAIQEFLSAVKLLKGEEHQPQRILCCSTLANSYLQLDRYDDAIQWAREGLLIKDMKDFEWKALQYDLGRALERNEDSGAALETFRKIAQRDKKYRDIPQRIQRLAAQD